MFLARFCINFSYLCTPNQTPIMLEQEIKYFNDHKETLIESYTNRYIVIVGDGVYGSYDTENDAFIAASKKYAAGKFLIKLCSHKTDSYTQTFHSRASFI